MVGGSSAGPGADSKIIHHEDGEPITSRGVVPGLGLAPHTRKFLKTLKSGQKQSNVMMFGLKEINWAKLVTQNVKSVKRYTAGTKTRCCCTAGRACGLQIQLRNLVAGWPLVTCVLR